jgi:hypothetical protein
MSRGFGASGRALDANGRGIVAGVLERIIDSVEDGEISEYNADSPFAASTARAFEGSYAIQEDHPEAASMQYAVSTSGLNYYPVAGDTIEYRNYLESDSAGNPEARFIFGAQDSNLPPNDAYIVALDTNDGHIEIIKRSGGGSSTLNSTGASPPTDEWLRVTIDWQTDGTITVSVYDSADSLVGSVQASDQSFASGGVGYGLNYWNAGSGSGLDAEVYWDSVKTI